MELLLLLLLAPVIWLVFLPARVMGHVRRYPFAEAGVIAGLLLAAWLGFNALGGAPQTTDAYERGDEQLRALLD